MDTGKVNWQLSRHCRTAPAEPASALVAIKYRQRTAAESSVVSLQTRKIRGYGKIKRLQED
jgi:hypothetical protein